MRKIIAPVLVSMLIPVSSGSALALDISGMLGELGNVLEATEKDDVGGMLGGLGNLFGALSEGEDGTAGAQLRVNERLPAAAR